MAPAELRTSVTRVSSEAVVEPAFLKSTVAFVRVPAVVGLGETACKEMPVVDARTGARAGVGAGERAGRVGAGDGADRVGLGDDAPPPATLTEKDVVARPAPPCQSSNPA